MLIKVPIYGQYLNTDLVMLIKVPIYGQYLNMDMLIKVSNERGLKFVFNQLFEIIVILHKY